MKQERQKGSITVEATLFIPIFLFAFMSIYSLVSFARAQLLIQYAADQAAREVAQYSYILEKQEFWTPIREWGRRRPALTEV